MPLSKKKLTPRTQKRTMIGASLCVAGLVTSIISVSPATAAATLPINDAFRATADIGFRDWTRDGSAREITNHLTGELGAMVEFAQESTVTATGNAANGRPSLVAEREALLLVTPTTEVASLKVDVRVKGELLGTLDLNAPSAIPAADQNFPRDSVAYSLRAWSAEIPSAWMKAGMTLTITDGAGRTGALDAIDFVAPKEIVINNIRLGMLTSAPSHNGHRFITDPVASATDYYSTIPVAKLTMAQYETVELDEVIVYNGSIYTIAGGGDPGDGGVYGGTMREAVGKAQVSTGINLATWGITSSAMNQSQPGHTNQRVIHHSAGLYKNGRQTHGLSGGNGMATLIDSVGNELSHELGHSYGLGHYPGMDWKKTGDDIARNASHNMDSGWGYIAYRNLMRSNLDGGGFSENRGFNGADFRETLKGQYNFNRDAMSGGWDSSPVSIYTHHTAYSLRHIQGSLKNLVADTEYPSGYKDWDNAKGEWVDAKQLNPNFSLPKPEKIGGTVFTLLGGYNPGNAAQTLVYDAFRSNYGVTFDLPQSDPNAESATRACWLQVDFQDAPTQHITLMGTDGMKQFNVNIAEEDKPTSAQIACRQNGVTELRGNKITIATDLEPMRAATVVGGEAGYSALRAQELAALESTLEGLKDSAAPVLSTGSMQVLQGWQDDLSQLSAEAREVADRVLKMDADARDIQAYLAENAATDVTAADDKVLSAFLEENGYTNADGDVVPANGQVTIENRCLYVDDAGKVRVSGTTMPACGEEFPSTWFVDIAGRIHSGETPEKCLTSGSPVGLVACSITDANQRWTVKTNGQVLRASNNGQAMDYFRHQGYPGIYGATGNSNQIWKGLVVDTNPVYAYLDSSTLAAYVGNVAPVAAPIIIPPDVVEEAPGTDAPVTEAPGTDAPGTDAPGTDAPGTDAPGTDAPGTDAPGTDAPGTDAPGLGTEPVPSVGDNNTSIPVPGETPTEGSIPSFEDETEAIGVIIQPIADNDGSTPAPAPSETTGNVGGSHEESPVKPAPGTPAAEAAADQQNLVDDAVASAAVAEELSATGTNISWVAVGLGFMLLLAGAAVLLFRRSREA